MRKIDVKAYEIRDFFLMMEKYDLVDVVNIEFDAEAKELDVYYKEAHDMFKPAHVKHMKLGDKITVGTTYNNQLWLEEAEFIIDKYGKYAFKSENFDIHNGIYTHYWFQLEGGNENEIYK